MPSARENAIDFYCINRMEDATRKLLPLKLAIDKVQYANRNKNKEAHQHKNQGEAPQASNDRDDGSADGLHVGAQLIGFLAVVVLTQMC